MSSTAKISVQEPGEDIWVVCARCDKETCHESMTRIRVSDGDEQTDWVTDYVTVQCKGCKTVSFCQEATSSDDIDQDRRTGETIHPVTRTLFPSRVAGRAAITPQFFLPPKIRGIYAEARKALCSEMPVLAGIGLRALVETILNERGAAGTSLHAKISDLFTKNIVNAAGAEILHGLRIMGNEAAHEVKAHTIEELGLGFSAVEYIMMGAYILPRKAAQLPKAK